MEFISKKPTLQTHVFKFKLIVLYRDAEQVKHELSVEPLQVKQVEWQARH